MCGITGIYNMEGTPRISVEELARMTETLRHRGPDDSGLYVDDHVGLGHTRLSIVGLAGGTQPIHNGNETAWIIYNGEVFNYPELKQDLVRQGHRFYTETDTEVVLHMYEEHGLSFLDRLNGQFALAIWDCRKKLLILARDRLGIRPLHYLRAGGRFLFASEIKSIRAAKNISLKLDPFSMDQLFTFWSTLPGKTIFKGVSELLPGHYAVVSGNGVKVSRYWEPPFGHPDIYTKQSLEEIVSEISGRLNEAIRIRMRADVPVGCYVSGGLDSSGIASIVKQDFNQRVKTFALRFEAEGFDEGDYQKDIVSWLKVDHASLCASNSTIADSLCDAVWHCETPLLRMGPVPLFLLSRFVRDRGLKVILTGEGADEIFGGYNIFREAKVRSFWATYPSSEMRPRLLGRLYPYILNDPRLRGILTSFFGTGLQQPNSAFFSHLVRWQNTGKLKTFFSGDLRATLAGYNGYGELASTLPDGFDSWDYLARAQYLESQLFMSNYLLSSQGDRVAMAHSVEIRLPFLDHRLVEFMARVPSKWKIRGMNEKYVLKRALAARLPESIVKRPKQPYRAPIVEALVQGEGRTMVRDLLTPRRIEEAGIFDPHKLDRLLTKLERIPNPGELDGMALVGVLTTQLIDNQFVGSPIPKKSTVLPRLVIDRRT